jgi:hypothetical protein
MIEGLTVKHCRFDACMTTRGAVPGDTYANHADTTNAKFEQSLQVVIFNA